MMKTNATSARVRGPLPARPAFAPVRSRRRAPMMALALMTGLSASAAGPALAQDGGQTLHPQVDNSLDDSLARTLSDIFGGGDERPQSQDPLPEPDPVIGGDDASATPVIQAPEANGPSMTLLSESDRMPDMSLAGISRLPVVVELFTSQGCSNCPPADAMIGELAELDDILALTFNVDYWDYLGWADIFAQPQYTERQQKYAYAAGERSVYTPQVIVEGQDTALELRPTDLMAMVDAHRAAPAELSVVTEEIDGRRGIELQPLSDLGGALAVLMVHYVPRRDVEVTAGENAGRVITYRNVVVGVDRLAEWDGRKPLRINLDEHDHVRTENLPEDTRNAVVVQQFGGPDRLPGPIVGALRLD